jgi:hypothetical protein
MSAFPECLEIEVAQDRNSPAGDQGVR